MSNKKDEDINDCDKKYGEYIPTYFDWVSPDKQKEIADKLANITRKEKK